MEKRPLPPRIDSERLTLKKHDPALAETMFRAVEEDRARLGRFLPWVERTRTLADEASYIATTLAAWDAGTLFDYGMFERASGEYLGNIGLHGVSWSHDRCELGYWVRGRHEGKGYVTEAVKALEGACFALGFHRIEIRCSTLNARSAAVPKRLGYVLDGVLREDTMESGRYRSTEVYGLLNPGQP